jgi:hypothetical protein
MKTVNMYKCLGIGSTIPNNHFTTILNETIKLHPRHTIKFQKIIIHKINEQELVEISLPIINEYGNYTENYINIKHRKYSVKCLLKTQRIIKHICKL